MFVVVVKQKLFLSGETTNNAIFGSEELVESTTTVAPSDSSKLKETSFRTLTKSLSTSPNRIEKEKIGKFISRLSLLNSGHNEKDKGGVEDLLDEPSPSPLPVLVEGDIATDREEVYVLKDL